MGHEFLINNISSYDTNIMLAAIISLLVVILFVLLLHIYARWFFTSLIPTSTSSSTSQPFSYTFPTSTFHHNFHSSSSSSSSPSKGLDPSLVSSIPLFIYSKQQQQQQKGNLLEECVICLSVFEANEVGRRLKKCGHGFHVECIDMWLRSHLNCPICRAPAAVDHSKEKDLEVDQIVVVVDVENENTNNNNNNDNSVVNYDSSSSSSSSSMGCSLKRMLSRNRLEGCSKVFPSVLNN